MLSAVLIKEYPKISINIPKNYNEAIKMPTKQEHLQLVPIKKWDK